MPRRALRDVLPLAKGLFFRHVVRPVPLISDQPHLPNAAAQKWWNEVARSEVMVEYGTGGSTVAAVRHVSHLVSVESDARFLTAIERTVSAIPDRGEFHPISVDIGATWNWGMPVAIRPTARRLKKWRAYPAAPWLELERIGAVPDLIVVDGRFRVACVLESMLRLPDAADCIFLMDDFVGREDMYGTILEFIEGVAEHDRMISFRKKFDFSTHRCNEVLKEYYCDYR